MEIDLRLLQYAVVLARHRHFGRAASVLGISQPTLSRNIAALEKQVGVRVFERSRRDVVATPAGDDFLKMADELVSRAEAIANRLQMVRDGVGGRLRVASGTYVHDIAVLPAAAEMIRDSPTLRLELLEREWTAVLGMLMIDQVDFAVFDVSALARLPALRVESLGKVSGVYFCRLPSIAVSSFRSARDIVAGTDAISLGHVTQIVEGLAAGRLAALHLPWIKKPPSVEMGVAWKRERTLLPAARAFIKLIRKHVRNAQAAESHTASRRGRRSPVGA